MTVLPPHRGQLVLRRGPAPGEARHAVIMVHGRGASADDMMGLSEAIDVDDVAWMAPQAAGSVWYPYSFLAPLDQNEPGLSSALSVIGGLVAELGQQQVPAARVALLGFSQGACLALEFAARHAGRYAAVFGLSGGLIGPPGTPRAYAGSLERTPVFLGCSDIDAHIPVGRVRESSEVFRGLGASVDERIYTGMGHVVNEDELEVVRTWLGRTGTQPGAEARPR